MTGLLTRDMVIEGAVAEVCQWLGDSGPDEKAAVAAIVERTIAHMTPSRETPARAASAYLWIMLSALWEGKVDQKELDQFFSTVDLDMLRLFGAWRALKADAPRGEFSVVLVPGKLTDHDITKVAEALYLNRRPD